VDGGGRGGRKGRDEGQGKGGEGELVPPHDFPQFVHNVCVILTSLTTTTNVKLHMRFRLAPRSMTLDDLERL